MLLLLFLLATNLSIEVSPKQPKANNATASIRPLAGATFWSEKLLWYNVRHNVKEHIIPTKRLEEAVPLSSENRPLTQSLNELNIFLMSVCVVAIHIKQK